MDARQQGNAKRGRALLVPLAPPRRGTSICRPRGFHAGDIPRRRQAAALQGASRIFISSGGPSDHGICAQGRL